MEYIDGEDLRSLLRRIGRLPGDKAVEMARRLCAGLAAAHDKGILHRDLKPANIMLDGRGQVLITDFGLAIVAGQIHAAAVRDGTPAYQAPEQRDGKEVTVRSDIYALGLILHEMFTGKRPDESVGSARTSLVKDLDPVVERVILRCLEPDPHKRPQAALAVARSLPGGDPLAAALAAGDTPSPQMVAAAGDTEAISVRMASVAFGVLVAGLIASAILGNKTNLLQQTPFELPSAALEVKAREMIRGFGYTDPPADHVSGFEYDADFQRYGESQKAPAEYKRLVARGAPSVITFWYRQSPRYLADPNNQNIITPSVPPPIQSGMVNLTLDTQGQLIELAVVPPQREQPTRTSPLPDWRALFTAAGLDIDRFAPSDPEWFPL
jgi:Protein kinase domain